MLLTRTRVGRTRRGRVATAVATVIAMLAVPVTPLSQRVADVAEASTPPPPTLDSQGCPIGELQAPKGEHCVPLPAWFHLSEKSSSTGCMTNATVVAAVPPSVDDYVAWTDGAGISGWNAQWFSKSTATTYPAMIRVVDTETWQVPPGDAAWTAGGGGGGGPCTADALGYYSSSYVLGPLAWGVSYKWAVVGHITQSASGQPAPGITVDGACNKGGGTTTTDDHGRYEFLVSPGPCTVTPQLIDDLTATPESRALDVESNIYGVDFQVPCGAIPDEASNGPHPASEVPGASDGLLEAPDAPGTTVPTTAPTQQPTGFCTTSVSLKIVANPTVTEDASGGGELDYSVSIKDRGPLNITGGKLAITLSPEVVLQKPSQATFTKTGIDVAAGNTATVRPPKLSIPTDVAKKGSLINGMDSAPWAATVPKGLSQNTSGQQPGWKGTSPVPQLNNENLVYSDYPEYLCGDPTPTSVPCPVYTLADISTATQRETVQGGNEVEGIMYKQRARDAVQGNFRIYFNHENRTNVEKAICVVVYNPSPSPVKFTLGSTGYGAHPGNPVQTGQSALVAWESARRHPKPQTVSIPGDSGGMKKPNAYAFCHGPHDANGATGVVPPGGGVLNAIIDANSSGPVTVGVVAINANRETQFLTNPLTYQFADVQYPKGDPRRTFLSNDTPLYNPTESKGHVAATFSYDAETDAISYDLNNGKRYGVLLMGNPIKDKTQLTQYQPADGKYVVGNFGVLYTVSVQIKGVKGETVQVLADPRGVGTQKLSGQTVRGAIAGVVDQPAPTANNFAGVTEIQFPNVAGKNMSCTDQAVGIGTAPANSTYTAQLMLPGGATGPVAIVLTPAYIEINAKLTWNGGSAAAKAKFVTMEPRGTVSLGTC